MAIKKRIKIRGPKGELEKEGIIDTGADLTLIPEVDVMQLGVTYTGFSSGTTASGDRITLARTDLTIGIPSLGVNNHTVNVAVSKSAPDILVGMDVLRSLNINIDTKAEEISVKNEFVDDMKTFFAVVGIGAIAVVALYAIFSEEK